jgi:hypothetical protein
MATRDELFQALRNADASGDADGARKLAAYIQSMPAEQAASPAAKQVADDAITRGAKNFAADMPLFDQAAAGVGKAVVDAGRGIKGLFTDNSAEVAESRRLDAPLMDTAAGMAGNIGGQVLTTLAPGGAVAGVGKLAGLAGAARAGNALSGVGRAAMTPTTIRGAATLGAAAGAAQPALDWQERAENTAMGGGGAAGGQAALRGLARVVRPQTDANALALLREGVTPTPGQLLGGGFKRTEEALTSVPIVGDAIKGGQARAVADLNRSAISRALEPIGEALPKGVTGREAIEYAGETLGKRYDALLPKLTTQADGQFISEMASLRNMIGSGSIDPAKAAQFEAILNNQVLSKFQAGAGGAPTLTGQTVKAIEADLGQLASKFRRSTDPDQQTLGDALLEVQSALRGNVQRSNPQFADELKAINQGYANFKRVQRAASSVAAEDGVFSAAQLQSAVKALDRSKDKAAFARGDALMQDLAEPARAVLGAKVPDSGTALRSLTALGAGGAAGGFIGPGAATAVLAAPVMYSRAGQNALAALLARRPDAAVPIENALRRLAPYAPAPALAASNQQR